MKQRFRLGVTAAVLAGTAGLAAPAHGQCRLCAPGTATETAAPALPVAIEVETILDFDKLILLGPGEGMARLAPDGTKATSGAIQGLRGRAMVGSFIIRGEPGRAIVVDLPDQIELFGVNGGRLTIRRVSSDVPADPRLDSTGRLTIRFGGELQVVGEADGDYRGEVPVTVQYL